MVLEHVLSASTLTFHKATHLTVHVCHYIVRILREMCCR